MIRRILVLMALVVLVTTGCDIESVTQPTTTASSGDKHVPATATSSDSARVTPSASDESVRVVRVVDGDTIIVEIDGREERLRYIGIDTPETVRPNTPVECFGNEASAENARLVEGKRVELERDTSNRDRFDRLLRYVYVIEDGQRIFVNEALVANGFAYASTFPPDVKYEEQLRSAQREARDERRGLWRACTP